MNFNARFYGPPDPVIPVIWNLQTGKEVTRLSETRSLAVSPNAKTIALTLGDSVTLWDVESQKPVSHIRSADAEFESLKWSADSKTLAAIRKTTRSVVKGKYLTQIKQVELICWDLATRKELFAWAIDPETFALSRDGKYVAAIDKFSRLEIREIRTGKWLSGAWLIDNQLMAIVPKTEPWCRGRLVFMSDGTLLLRDVYHGFRRFDVATGKRVDCPSGDPRRQGFDLSPDGKTIVRPEKVYFSIEPIAFRDLATGNDRASLGQHRSRIQRLIVGKRESILLSQDGEGELRVWDLNNGKSLPMPACGRIAPHCFGFMNDGRAIVAVGEDTVARVWESRTGKIVRQFQLADFSTLLDRTKFEDSYYEHRSEKFLSLSADKSRVAIAGIDRVTVWDVTTGKPTAFLKEPNEQIKKIALTADGKSIAITADESLIVRTVDGKQRQRIDRMVSTINFRRESKLELSPEGRFFAHVAKDLTVYEIATSRKMCTIPVDARNCSVAFTFDGKSLVLASGRQSVDFYEVSSGKPIASVGQTEISNEFFEHVNHLPPGVGGWPDYPQMDAQLFLATIDQMPSNLESTNYYICSNDKRFIACAKEENVAIFETRTGQKIASFDASPKGDIGCLLFLGDGRRLVTGSSNSTIHVWDWLAAAQLQPNPHARPSAYTWIDLASDDAGKAYRSVNLLVQHPCEAVQLLRERLQPVSRQQAQQVRDWIAALDHARFSVRDQARRSLQQCGEDALAQLQAAKKEGRLSPEMDTTVTALIAAVPAGARRENRQVRAIHALEWINTAESRQLLRELADGDPNALRTREAAKALQRQ